MKLAPSTNTDFDHVPWSRNANIYSVNVRQYTPEGTLAAFASHLPRLKKMGVDILWLMPVQPIGLKNRKGTLGSYYAISDYTAVNPEFGTLDDFRAVVKQAHALGMKVILDWVANHTAWDHPWTKTHTDWYKLDAKGEIFPVTFTSGPEPEYWTDVVALDYTQRGLWDGMTEAMAFWLRETDIDGFRCDVAGLLPTSYWNHARAALDVIKPVFMLAEWSEPELHEHAFDMTYCWELTDVFKAIGKGTADAGTFREWVRTPKKNFPRSAYRMLFTNNHDINSWHGTDAELYGPAYQVCAVLTATLPGMQLIYSGQESRLTKRLEFFEKDPIAWKQFELQDFYAGLLKLKKQHAALWNGQYGGDLALLDVGNDKLFAFRRQRDDSSVTVIANLSDAPQTYYAPGRMHVETQAETLAPWSWRILTP
jgi:glycosidase